MLLLPSHGGKSEAQARRGMSDTAMQKLLNWAAEVSGDMKSTGGTRNSIEDRAIGPPPYVNFYY